MRPRLDDERVPGESSILTMTDVFTSEKRSEVMSRIRGQDTKPELALRSMLHRLGYRFTVKGAKNRSLPGRPDLVLPKFQTVIFVHGCFWHGHEGCPHFRMPKTRRKWWTAKIEGNRARDIRNENELRALGWHVVTIWECALKNASARLWLETRIPSLLGNAEDPSGHRAKRPARAKSCPPSLGTWQIPGFPRDSANDFEERKGLARLVR